MNKSLLLAVMLLGSIACLGQQHSFHYKRALADLEPGWNRITLPDELFEKTRKDLADIRILGISAAKDTIETPYILKHYTDESVSKKLPFELINHSFREGMYYFTFKVSAAVPYNELTLRFSEQNFDWKVTLEGSRNQNEWFTLTENTRILSIKNNQADYTFSTLHFPAADYPYLRISLHTPTAPHLLSADITEQKKEEAIYREYPLKKVTRQEDKQLKQTIAELELFHAVPVSKLNLAVRNKQDYYRFLQIQCLTDSFNTPKGWQYVYETIATGVLNSKEKAVYHFEERITKKLRIIIRNEDNAPLDPDSFRVSGYVYELLVKAEKPADYFMLYGDPDAEAPVYDLGKFTQGVPENIKTIKPGSEELNTREMVKKEPLFKNKAWLWAIICLIMAVLGWFALKMIRNA